MKFKLSLLVFSTVFCTAFAQTDSSSTNKPDIKELVGLPAFTNSAGVVLVRISSTLWAGKYPVTQKEYSTVTGANPSQFQGARNPVDSVSWNNAVSFCEKLTQLEKKEALLLDGFIYTLPTQQEWEQLMDGASLQDAVTSQRGNRTSTAAVGSLGANSLGLHDTRGNVWQFCLDPQDKPYRVLRGGAWNSSLEVNLRPEFRWYSDGPDDRKNTFGFRVVLKPASGR